jgi:hypothetical protein
MTISKNISLSDFNHQDNVVQLKDQALTLIGNLAGENWSDHNNSDPGITILEVLAFAISDLSERLHFPMEDLLQGIPNQAKPKPFFAPETILPSNPVTLIDHRRALIDIDGVKNANLMNHYEGEGHNKQVTGSFNIVLDLEDDIFSIKDLGIQQAKIFDVIHEVRQRFISQRNVNEDIASIKIIPKKLVILAMDIELSKAVDPLVVVADLLSGIAENIAPSISTYRHEQLLEKDMAGDEIFDGPLLEQGFILAQDVDRIGMPVSLYSSDILASLQDINGLKNVNNFSFKLDEKDLDDITQGVLEAMDNDSLYWRRDIPKNHIASLNLAETYSNLKIKIDGQDFKKPIYDDIITQQNKTRKTIEVGSGIPALTQYVNGQYRQLKNYSSIQHQLPSLYKLAEKRLDGAVNSTAMAQILQFKGFLTLFDQVLSDQFAQLESLKTLLALPTQRVFYRLANTFSKMLASESLTQKDIGQFWQDVKQLPRTQVSQPIKNISGMSTLLGNYFESYLNTGFQNQAEGVFSFVQLDRLKRSLEHLFSRFAETSLDASLLKYNAVFNEYIQDLKQSSNAIAASDNSNNEDQALLTKLVSLKQTVDLVMLINDYPTLSKLRSGGFNYLLNNPKQSHTGGLTQRSMRFLGLFRLDEMPLATNNKEGFYLIESELIRFGAFDPFNTTNSQYRKDQLYFIAPEWPSRFANEEFRTLLESQLVKDCPVHMQPFIIYLPREAMSLFERLYFSWLNAMSNLPLTTDALNDNYIDQTHEKLKLVSKLSDMLRQFFNTPQDLYSLLLTNQVLPTIIDELKQWLTATEFNLLDVSDFSQWKSRVLEILKSRYSNNKNSNKLPEQALFNQILFSISQKVLDNLIKPFPISQSIIGRTFRIGHKPLNYLQPAYPIGNGVINPSAGNETLNSTANIEKIPTFTLGIKTPHTI